MPLSATSLARLSNCHPLLVEKAKLLEAACISNGIEIAIVQGFRSWAEQDSLYQLGRSRPGAIVTKAPAGHSWHNFGLAFDCAPVDMDTRGIDWHADHPSWKLMEAIGEGLGMVSGSTWRSFPDAPHFQLTGKLPVSPNDETRQLFKDGGCAAVWDAAGLDSETAT